MLPHRKYLTRRRAGRAPTAAIEMTMQIDNVLLTQEQLSIAEILVQNNFVGTITFKDSQSKKKFVTLSYYPKGRIVATTVLNQ